MTTVRFEAFDLPAGFRSEDLPSIEIPVGAGPGSPLTVVVPDMSAASVQRLAAGLRGSGAALGGRTASELAEVLGRVGERFGDEADDVRREALALLPGSAGISSEMAREILDGMAADWTRARLHSLLAADFENPGALDGVTRVRGRDVMAVGPTLCVQIVSGSVPGVGVTALLRSLLVKGPTLLKPGLGDVVLSVLFARALREEDPELADCLGVVYWPGGSTDLERAATAEADVVTVYGDDEAVASVRAATLPTARVVSYHHRVSIGIIGRDALEPESVGRVTADVAWSVGMFDQKGCVCPQLVFVEEGGAIGAADFAETLAGAIAALETRVPGGPLDADDGAALHQMRGNAELRAVTGQAKVYHGGDQASWSVIFEAEPHQGPTCFGRSVRVRALSDARVLTGELEGLREHLQTVAFAGLEGRVPELAPEWARLGASRITPFRDVPFPPPWWLHDGHGPLQELVRWVEITRP